MRHPFAELIGLRFEEQRAGYSRCVLQIGEKHLNPNGVAHGAVLYALADTGMGAALHPTLEAGQICATIQITMRARPTRVPVFGASLAGAHSPASPVGGSNSPCRSSIRRMASSSSRRPYEVPIASSATGRGGTPGSGISESGPSGS